MLGTTEVPDNRRRGGPFEWRRCSTDGGRLCVAGRIARDGSDMCTGLRRWSGAQTYKRSKRRELGGVRCKDSYIVVVARL